MAAAETPDSAQGGKEKAMSLIAIITDTDSSLPADVAD